MKIIQWNPSIAATIEEFDFGHYRRVAQLAHFNDSEDKQNKPLKGW